MSNLLQRLQTHIAHMAPHQKQREQGKLLIECLAELQSRPATAACEGCGIGVDYEYRAKRYCSDRCAQRMQTLRDDARRVEIMNLDVNRHPTTCRPSLSTMLKSVGLSFILLASGARSMAQRGVGTTFNNQQPTLNIQGAFALAPAPVKQKFLTWGYIPGVTYRVQVGATRGNYTNSFTVSTNQFPLTNGLAYAVWSVQGAIESAAPGLWPSNRVGELWLTGMGTNFTGGTNIVRLAKFTNSPPGNMQLWGVANITTGWE